MEVILLLVLVIFGCIGYGMLKRYLLDQAQVRRREMVHKERMTAMEKGLPIENLEFVDEPVTTSSRSQEKVLVWVRLVSLCTGLVCVLGGVGISVAFYYSSISDLREAWTVGTIPVLAGVGLLLFFAMSKSFKESLKSE